MASRGVIAVLAVLSLSLLVPGAARGGPPRPATPEEVAALVKAAGEAKDHPGADAVVVLDESDVAVRPTGLALTESRRVVKILTEAGALAEAVQRLSFDPATHRSAFRAVTVLYRDGRVAEVDLRAAVRLPPPQDALYWGGERVLLSVPRLAPGDALEIRTARIGFNVAYLASDGLSEEGLVPPMAGHWFDVVRFPEGRPVKRKRLTVRIPSPMSLTWEVYGGPLRSSRWTEGDAAAYTFAAENLPAVKGEPSMVAWEDCLPKVVMSTVPDWREKSRWFAEVNAGQFAADDAIRAKVAEITAGLPDDEAKIDALLHWVADSIRYCGTSRGPREGYTLHTGIETFRERAGVCKDIAGMLITMLRAAGYEAHPTLTMAGSRVEAVPADQFNHTVVAIRAADGGWRFLDPTWSPTSRELWSSREAEQGVVVGTAEGEDLGRTPYYPPEANALRATAESRIDAAGDLTTTIAMSLTGYPCTYFRRNVHRHAPADRKAAFEEALGIAPGAALAALDHTDPLDYSRDSAARLTVAAAGFAAGGDLRVFRLPLLQNPLGSWLMPDLLAPPPEGERKYDFRLRATRLVSYRETIALPPGAAVTDLPAARDLDTPAASLRFRAVAEGGTIHVELDLSAKKHVVPAAEVEGLRQVLAAAKEIREARVAFRLGEGR